MELFKKKKNKQKIVKIDYDTIYEFNGTYFQMNKYSITQQYGWTKTMELTLSDVNDFINKENGL